MGSPYTHIYQHYFSRDYQQPGNLEIAVNRWLNIFRCDDYIGTHIDGPDAWPENIPITPGGHTDYLRDERVLSILRDNSFPN